MSITGVIAEPVKQFKKKPLLIGGIAAGIIGLIILFKPKETVTDDYIAYSEYPESLPASSAPGGGSGGGSDPGASFEDPMPMILDLLSQFATEQETVMSDFAQQQNDLLSSIEDYDRRSYADITEQVKTQIVPTQIMADPETPRFTNAQEILAQIERNSLLAGDIYKEVKSWQAPEIDELHKANLGMAMDLGGSYDPGTGTYFYRQGTAGQKTIDEIMAANSQKARSIYEVSGSWNDPAIVKLNQENIKLGSQVGKVYNPSTGSYTSGSAAPAAALKPSSGVGSNQYQYLQGLVSAGGGNGEWAKKELAAGRY